MKSNEILKAFGTEYKDMTIRLLEKAQLCDEIKTVTGKTQPHIFIKPNLVSPTPAEFGGTTHPEIVAGIIEYLQASGYTDITIAEGSWVGDKTEDSFEYCGYNALANAYGVKLLDTQKEDGFMKDCGGLELELCNCVKDIDFLINVPVLKGHCQTRMTCALKNMKGLIPNREKRRFHQMGLHKPIAHLNLGIHQDFIVADHICGDLDFEDGGNPVIRNCIMAGKDPVLIDSCSCNIIGLAANAVEYVTFAETLGVGSADLSKAEITVIEGEDTDELAMQQIADGEDQTPDASTGRRTDIHGRLDVSYMTDAVGTCSACYCAFTEAMLRIREEGWLDKIDFKISIGQGHQGKSGETGIGACTSKFKYSAAGCPPDAETVYRFIESMIKCKSKQTELKQ